MSFKFDLAISNLSQEQAANLFDVIGHFIHAILPSSSTRATSQPVEQKGDLDFSFSLDLSRFHAEKLLELIKIFVEACEGEVTGGFVAEQPDVKEAQPAP